MRAVPLLVLLAGCRGLLGFEEPVIVDGAPELNFAAAATSADEASGTVDITVTLSEPATERVSVGIDVAGTATPDQDFTLADLVVNLEAGEVEQTISLAIVADGIEEDIEDIALELVTPAGALLGPNASHTITIANDILPRVAFTDSVFDVTEANAAALELTLDKPTTIEVRIGYRIIGGSAIAGTDYMLDDGEIVFDAGSMAATLTLPTIDDLTDEDDETVQLELLNPSAGLVLGGRAVATCTLADNDEPPLARFAMSTSQFGETNAPRNVRVDLGAASAKSIEVPFTIAGNANLNTDYTLGTTSPLTFATGVTSRTITINIIGDPFVEPSEVVEITLGTPINAALGTPAVHELIILNND